MLLTTASLLSLAASVSAAVCPTGNTFRIHPVGRPGLCVGVSPADYTSYDDFKSLTHLGWPLVKLVDCTGHWSQEWEWIELNGKKALRNPGQLDKWVDPPYPKGMIPELFQYRFPVGLGSTWSLHWLQPQSENYPNPEREWTYTSDLKLVSGWTFNGHATCMNYSLGIDTNGEGPWNIEVGLCRDNDRYQQWLIEPLK